MNGLHWFIYTFAGPEAQAYTELIKIIKTGG